MRMTSDYSSLEELQTKYAPWGSGLKNGYTHLHMAMMSIAPVSDVRRLLEANPESAITQDTKDGYTALHIAAQRYGYNPDAIQTLVTACPEAAKISDFKEGKLPLHYAVKHTAALGSVIALLDAYPSAAEVTDESGRTPLHISLIEKRVGDDIIKAIIDQHPASVEIRYKNWNALFWAMGCDASARIVEAILQKNPSLAAERDGTGSTPLHVGMIMRTNTEAIRILLKTFEDAANVKDHDGCTALQHGIRNKAPADAIEIVRLVSPQLPRAAGSRKPYEFDSPW